MVGVPGLNAGLVSLPAEQERGVPGFPAFERDLAAALFAENCHQFLPILRLVFMGYGRETLTEILRYGFEELGVNKVWLEAYPDNAPGTHLYDSMGFHRDGLRRQHSKEERGFLDEIQYSMLKSEYKLLKR